MAGGRPMKARLDGWGKEAVLREMSAGASLRQVTTKYALEADSSCLIKEVQIWRQTDEGFCAAYEKLLADRGDKPPRSPIAGVKKADLAAATADWRVKYCEDLYTLGSRVKAAANSPYDYSNIYKFLNPKYPQYDREFAELVHLVEMRMCAEAEGSFFEALRAAESPKDRAWIASKWLERRDPTRWSRQVEMIHSGTVKHEHEHQVLPREQRLAELAASQQAYFQQHAPQMLPAGQVNAIEEPVVIDVEFALLESAEVLDA